jgi:hypothetical protein
MKLTGLLLLTLSLAACGERTSSTTAPAAPPPDAHVAAAATASQTAQQFWTGFRAAVAINDSAALAAMARFPFVTRGVTDDDPKVSHDEATFAALLPKLLAQDTGLGAQPESVSAFVARHADLPPIALGGGQFAPVPADATQFSAGPLQFEKSDEKWLWASAYLEE